MSKAGKEIIEGLNCALDHARTRQAVLDWIRDDVPLATKMNLLPRDVDRLVDRICGTKTRNPNT